MVFKKITTYDLIEESITDAQLLAEFEIDEKNISYSITSNTPKYLKIIDNKVYLTNEGKLAVNKDNPDDISKELQAIVFTVTATNTETDKKISSDVTIKITRIIDTKPYVLNKFEHLLYTHNLYPNQPAAQIEMVYNSLCDIQGSNSSLFDIGPIPKAGTDNIKIFLNNNGVNHFNSLDFSKINTRYKETQDGREVYKHKLVLDITDATNNLTTIYNVYVKFVDGDKYNNEPIKNNLEIQAELLATKVADILRENNETLNKNDFQLSNLIHRVEELSLRETINAPEINKLKNELQEVLSNVNENIDFQADKVNEIVSSNQNLYSTIFSPIKRYFEKELNSDIIPKSKIFLHSNIKETFSTGSDIYSKSLAEYLMKRSDIYTTRKIETLINIINKTFRSFRGSIYSDIVATNTTKFSSIVSKINEIFTLINNIKTIQNKHEVLIENNSVNINSLDHKLQALENFEINDWCNTAHWTFPKYSINYDGTPVITNTAGSLAFSHNNRFSFDASDGSMTFDGSDLTLDGDVNAKLFSGTAQSSLYADLAEYYIKEIKDGFDYVPGTIVYLTTDEKAIFEVTEKSKNNIYCGVITTNPGQILNSSFSERDDTTCIALNGRVPVQIQPGKKIKKGMYIYPSFENPNKAEGTYSLRNTPDLIGIALENNFDLETQKILETDTVLVKVK